MEQRPQAGAPELAQSLVRDGGDLARPTLDSVILTRFKNVIETADMRIAAELLRDVAIEHGLGVAVLVAHQHGLHHGHIPLMRDAQGRPLEHQAIPIDDPPAQNPYRFISVPVRAIRGDQQALIDLGIMNPRPNPAEYVYHEEALVAGFTVDVDQMSEIAGRRITSADVRELFMFLETQQVLTAADVNSGQLHFKDPGSRRFIEQRREEQAYVRGTASWKTLMLPAKIDSPGMREYIQTRIAFKGPCNYCSATTLNPKELMIDSAEIPGCRDTVRSYRFGFTFAPFGDPREVCHFLAWDQPHIYHVVNNMDPQDYSFGDLIKLVVRINADLDQFCRNEGVAYEPISGVCNHWAGNSIYHQHYQFFRLPVPLHGEAPRKEAAAYNNVLVQRMEWEAPAYRIVPGPHATLDDLIFVARKVALGWGGLCSEKDTKYGNGIEINMHTQNIFVTVENGQPVAYFIPRRRDRLNTSDREIIQKKNAAVLEMLGYFLVDNPIDLKVLSGFVPKELFAKILRGGDVTGESVIAALKAMGYLNKDQKLSKEKLRAGDFSLEIGLPPETERAVYELLCRVPVIPEGRKALAGSWLRDLSPDAAVIDSFESVLKALLEETVVQYEHRIVQAAAIESRRRALMRAVVEITHEPKPLSEGGLWHLLEMVNQEYAKSDAQHGPLLSPTQVDELIARQLNG